MKKEEFEIPKITFKDVIRYVFPISMMVIFWFLAHMVNYAITFKELLIGFVDFIIQVGALFMVYSFSRLFINWLIEKMSHPRWTSQNKNS